MTQEEQKALVEGQQQSPVDDKAKATDDKADAVEKAAADAAVAADGKEQGEQPASGTALPIQKIWSDFFRIKSIRRSKATGSSPSERALRASKAAAKASAKAAKFAELAKAAAEDASRLAAEISKLALESAGGDVKAVEDVKPIAEDAAKQPEQVAAK